jgi:hypothetical protein
LYDFPLTGCWKRHSEFLLSLFPLSLTDQVNRAGRESKDGKEKRRNRRQKCETHRGFYASSGLHPSGLYPSWLYPSGDRMNLLS